MPAILTTTTKIFAPLPEERNKPRPGRRRDALQRTSAPYMDACGISWLARRREGEAPVPGRESERRMKLSGFTPSRNCTCLKLTVTPSRSSRPTAPEDCPSRRRVPMNPYLPEGLDAVLGVIGTGRTWRALERGARLSPRGPRANMRPGSGRGDNGGGGREGCARVPMVFSARPMTARASGSSSTRRIWEPRWKNCVKSAYIIWEIAGKPHGPADAILFTSCKNNECEVIFRIMRRMLKQS